MLPDSSFLLQKELKEVRFLTKNVAGRPPKYKNREEMQAKIDEYFNACEGRPLVVDGRVMLDKKGEVILYNRRPPTMTGLALALGFTSRQALLNYEGKKEFIDTITRARARVEQYTEERLFDKDGANGAKFSLANNFEGWKEKQQRIDADVSGEANIHIELCDD